MTNGVKENRQLVKITVILKARDTTAVIPRVNRTATAKVLNSSFQIQSSHTIFTRPDTPCDIPVAEKLSWL